MRFEANKAMYIIVMLLLMILCLCMPTKTVITPSPIGIEVMPATPEICVESAVPDITVSPVGEMPYKQRYTKELVIIAMKNRDYPWQTQVINGEYQIFPEYIQNGIWIVTVDFQSFSRQYIFDEVNHD